MKAHCKKFFLFSLILTSAILASEANAQTPSWRVWSIEKDSWSPSDEKRYSEFVRTLGESGCNNVDKCLRSTANYLATDTERQNVRWESDCGRFPYLLRAYFAWKNKLPFSYVSDVAANDGSGDLRYSPKGNRVTQRTAILQKSINSPIDGVKAIQAAVETINTAMYRFAPETDISNNLYFDLYSVAITRENIRPGTLVYDTNGHVAVVYKVEEDGRIRLFDAHPGNSISHIVYGEKFARSSPPQGAGFKNFRSLSLVGATRAANNALIGGVYKTLGNADLPGYSTEQFYGTSPGNSWKSGSFQYKGSKLGYYDFVRSRLAVGDLKYHPVTEMTNAMEAVCQDLRDRVDAVNSAINNKISQKSQPSNLPGNIYGTDGEWETYSSPSRDARLKVSFLEIRKNVETFFAMYQDRSPRLDYAGNDLAGDMRAAYSEAAQACQISYTKSNGETQNVSYEDAASRLFKMSFDPYHCIELRWGASDTSELNSCPDGSTKRAWYSAEQGLRNQLERTYSTKMGFSLEQLQQQVPGSGEATAPDVDLKGFLDRQ